MPDTTFYMNSPSEMYKHGANLPEHHMSIEKRRKEFQTFTPAKQLELVKGLIDRVCNLRYVRDISAQDVAVICSICPELSNNNEISVENKPKIATMLRSTILRKKVISDIGRFALEKESNLGLIPGSTYLGDPNQYLYGRSSNSDRPSLVGVEDKSAIKFEYRYRSFEHFAIMEDSRKAFLESSAIQQLKLANDFQENFLKAKFINDLTLKDIGTMCAMCPELLTGDEISLEKRPNTSFLVGAGTSQPYRRQMIKAFEKFISEKQNSLMSDSTNRSIQSNVQMNPNTQRAQALPLQEAAKPSQTTGTLFPRPEQILGVNPRPQIQYPGMRLPDQPRGQLNIGSYSSYGPHSGGPLQTATGHSITSPNTSSGTPRSDAPRSDASRSDVPRSDAPGPYPREGSSGQNNP